MIFVNGNDDYVARLVAIYVAKGWRIVRDIRLKNGHRVVRMVFEEQKEVA